LAETWDAELLVSLAALVPLVLAWADVWPLDWLALQALLRWELLGLLAQWHRW
jgi:hypothetical protein